jgi:hypothetical protein
MRRTLLLAVAMCTPALGCTTMKTVTRDEIKPRASFDLDCPEDELKVSLSEGGARNGTYGAHGCGKKVQYTADCSLMGTKCLISAVPPPSSP